MLQELWLNLSFLWPEDRKDSPTTDRHGLPLSTFPPVFTLKNIFALSKRVEHCASLVGIEHLTKWENSRASLADYCDKLISNYKKTQYRNAKDLQLTQESTDKYFFNYKTSH